ncbi:MAG: type II and III secretion system protein [Planctomycetes bacterium]|nr:type II and III secretion system protein [Planctomycetota bacterium]
MQKFVKLALLITFVSLAPVAILSQDDDDDMVKGANPPSARNSIELGDGRIKWRYHVQNRDLNDLKPLLDEYIVKNLATKSKKPGVNKYTFYHEQKAIIFIIEKKYIEYVQKLMSKIDAPRSQVMIEVKVFSLSYQKQTQSGWDLSHEMSQVVGNPNLYYRGFEFSFQPDDFLTALTANPPGTGASYLAAQDDFLGTTLFFNTAGDSLNRMGSLGGAVRLLSKTEKVNIVANPIVTVEAGYEVSIVTGEEVPVSTTKIVGTTTVVSTTFESVGIKLTLIPKTIGTEYVNLYVKPEVSAVSRFFDPGGSLASYPIIIRRNAETTVSIKTGETLEIGGLCSDRTLLNSTGIPILSDIPLLGYLFRANRVEIKRQDIVFIITPTIVKPGKIVKPEQFSADDKKYDTRLK